MSPPPRSFVPFTLSAGPGVLCVALLKRANHPSGGVELVSLKKKKKSTMMTRVTAHFPVHCLYESGGVEDEFRVRVFIACHVN